MRHGLPTKGNCALASSPNRNPSRRNRTDADAEGAEIAARDAVGRSASPREDRLDRRSPVTRRPRQWRSPPAAVEAEPISRRARRRYRSASRLSAVAASRIASDLEIPSSISSRQGDRDRRDQEARCCRVSRIEPISITRGGSRRRRAALYCRSIKETRYRRGGGVIATSGGNRAVVFRRACAQPRSMRQIEKVAYRSSANWRFARNAARRSQLDIARNQPAGIRIARARLERARIRLRRGLTKKSPCRPRPAAGASSGRRDREVEAR